MRYDAGVAFYSPDASLIKEREGLRSIRFGWERKEEHRRREEEEGKWKTTLTSGSHLSASQSENGRRRVNRAARLVTGRSGWLGLGPVKTGGGARARGEESWAAAGAGPRERAGQKPNELHFSFLFSFPNFQTHFSNDFQIKFEFDLNHSIQNSKCSSMNAQTCSYPYI
jgi:hypothetical protein